MNNPNKKLTVILAAGGTGGHVFPAKALAEALKEQGHRPVFITDKRTANYLNVKNIPVHVIPASSPGRGIISFPVSMVKIAWGMAKSSYYMSMVVPDVVIGFGGYPSFPTMEVARRRGYKTIIQEQNSVLGRVNKFLSSSVHAIATAFDSVKGIAETSTHKMIRIGNPVRAEVKALRDISYPALSEDSTLRVLVMGGSQGATVFSEIVPEAIKNLPDALKQRISVSQQCRASDVDHVRESYAVAGITAHVATFFDHIEEEYAKAHLLISRAGASTLAELTTIGLPAILVPYPNAMDDHQTANAKAAEESGGAWVMVQDNFTVDALSGRLTELFEAPEMLQKAAEKVKEAGEPDATEKLLALVERVANT